MSEETMSVKAGTNDERKTLSEKIQKEVAKLISVGKHRGSVTYDEV